VFDFQFNTIILTTNHASMDKRWAAAYRALVGKMATAGEQSESVQAAHVQQAGPAIQQLLILLFTTDPGVIDEDQVAGGVLGDLHYIADLGTKLAEVKTAKWRHEAVVQYRKERVVEMVEAYVRTTPISCTLLPLDDLLQSCTKDFPKLVSERTSYASRMQYAYNCVCCKLIPKLQAARVQARQDRVAKAAAALVE
jgi:hypothetical protein